MCRAVDRGEVLEFQLVRSHTDICEAGVSGG